jgi:glycosyltransferase involved in cell wall biosynthesis
MNGAGDVVRFAFHRAGVQPEAFAPNLAWTVTGRRRIRGAIAREYPDVVWATSPPQSAIFAAVSLARQAETPVVAELRDLWAGNPYFDAGGNLLTRLEARSLRHADAVVTVTPGCRDRLEKLHPELVHRIQLLPNGFDPALLALRDGATDSASAHDPRLDHRRNRATLIHAGALYGDRSAAALIRALARPSLRDRVRLELVGAIDPATRQAVEASPSALEIVVSPPVGWQEAIDRVRRADMSVVINSVGTGGAMALPSKLYEALALARPVVALTPPGSDTERLMRRFGLSAGVAAPDDEEAISAAVARLLDGPPAPVSVQLLHEFNRETVARKVAALLESVASAASARRG